MTNTEAAAAVKAGPRNLKAHNERPTKGLYKFGSIGFDDAEDRENYRPGGLHPVHIGDTICGPSRYRVLHKLGNGGLATVWLCRDLQAWRLVALKIIRADYSRDDCAELMIFDRLGLSPLGPPGPPSLAPLALPTKHFWINGPNGRHLCLVLPVLGPRVNEIWYEVPEPEKLLPRLALQTGQALKLLHDHGICHGDFRPHNILLRVKGFDHLTDEEIYDLLGEPKQDPVILANGRRPRPHSAAPTYIVYPADMSRVKPEMYTDDICIIDFGESYQAAHPPALLGIPNQYRSPELFFDKKAGIPSDLWAFACTVYEIVSGLCLFRDFDGDGEETMQSWAELLGRMPDPWWAAWEARGFYYDETCKPIVNSNGEPQAHEETLERLLSEATWTQVHRTGKEHWLKVPEADVAVLSEMLYRILKYDPEERPSMKDIMDSQYWEQYGASQQTTSPQIAPQQTTPQDPTQQATASRAAAPQDTAPEEDASDESMLAEGASDESMSGKSASDKNMSGESTSDDSVLEEGVSQEGVSAESVIEDSAVEESVSKAIAAQQETARTQRGTVRIDTHMV